MFSKNKRNTDLPIHNNTIKFELNTVKTARNRKNNILNGFINKDIRAKPQKQKIDIIKNRYHYASDIFFTKPIFSKSNFTYTTKNNNNTISARRQIHKSCNIETKKAPKQNAHHKKIIQTTFYYNENKYNPNLTSFENYHKHFESNIFNLKNKKYSKYINKGRNKISNIKSNNSVDSTRSRNIKVKGLCKWPSDLKFTQNSELIFKTHIRNFDENRKMSAFERAHVDSVKDLIENASMDKKIKNRTIKRNKSDLGCNNYTRPLFDIKKFGESRAKKLENNFFVLEDEKKYKNNIKIRNSAKKFDVKEYTITKLGNMDVLEFSKMAKSKGLHLIDVKEKQNILKIEDKNNKKDRIITFKIREDISDINQKNDIKQFEKELKKKNKQIKIKPLQNKKGFGLKSLSMYNKDNKHL